MGNDKKQAPTALYRMASRDIRNAFRVAEMLRIVNESDSPSAKVSARCSAGPFVDEDTAWNTLKALARSIE